MSPFGFLAILLVCVCSCAAANEYYRYKIKAKEIDERIARSELECEKLRFLCDGLSQHHQNLS